MTEDIESTKEFEGFATVAIVGNINTAGLIKEVMVAGSKMLRIDVPHYKTGDILVTQYYAGQAIYSITRCTRERAMRFLEKEARLGIFLPEPIREALGINFQNPF